MAEAATKTDNYSPFPSEDLRKYLRKFSYDERGEEIRWYYTTKKGVMMNIRDVNIHCLENAQIDIDLRGGRGNKVWQALEDEINRRKGIER
ncbi:MAG: hypothetical protein A4E64_02158 [Syntrophorhabdus sp. PtaU1.Bin058]|nr:MAG: hypothetical protein A4E64_02158 [Syntrophorhabdus sp. PtaU1.Bin058]